MNRSRKRILLVWWYEREDLFAPFKHMHDAFEYILLFRKFSEEDKSTLPYKRVYWTQFNDAQQLLSEIRPEKVVFMGIDSNYTIALNIACKRDGIETIHLEHGLRLPIYHYIDYYKKKKLNLTKIRRDDKTQKFNEKKWHSLLFLFQSLSLLEVNELSDIIKFVYRLYKMPVAEAMYISKFKFRLPSTYVNFTAYNARYITQRDGVSIEDIKLIGNPYFDRYFSSPVLPKPLDKPFYFLIDSPIWLKNDSRFEIGAKERDRFYTKVLEFCIKNGAKLVVKLHPAMYNEDDLLQNEDIVYVREVDSFPFILHSDGIFGTFSTLLLPAIFYKPCLLFSFDVSDFQDDLFELGIVTKANLFDFTPKDITFISYPLPKNIREEFIKRYFLYTDGKSLERLREVLLNEH